MKWQTLIYSRESKVRNHFCHPLAAKGRRLYIHERYNAEPTEIRQMDSMWLDMGGCVCLDDPKESIYLGGGRSFGCWSHHISSVVSKLHLATKLTISGFPYRKLGVWPGVIYIVSDRDARQIIAALDRKVDIDNEAKHRVRMTERLEDAQNLPRGSLAEVIQIAAKA